MSAFKEWTIIKELQTSTSEPLYTVPDKEALQIAIVSVSNKSVSTAATGIYLYFTSQTDDGNLVADTYQAVTNLTVPAAGRTNIQLGGHFLKAGATIRASAAVGNVDLMMSGLRKAESI